MNDPRFSEIKSCIATEVQSDVVGLWAVLWEVRRRVPELSAEKAREATLDVVRDVLVEGCAVAGDFCDKDDDTALFEPWPIDVPATLARLAMEWDALGEPNIGDIAWLVDPRLLPFAIKRHPMGANWTPRP
jgi:hypothetical protein